MVLTLKQIKNSPGGWDIIAMSKEPMCMFDGTIVTCLTSPHLSSSGQVAHKVEVHLFQLAL